MLLIAGGVTQYVATRVAMTVLGRADGSAPGGLAIGQWLPILATTIAALLLRQPLMAVTLIFGSSVACLSLLVGMTVYVNPVRRLPPQRTVWPLVFPVALFLLIAGFKAHLTWYHAIMLLVMGAAYLALWLKPPQEDAVPMPNRPAAPIALGPLLVAVVLSGFGAWAMIEGALANAARTLTPELIAATILSPLLLLPALGTGTGLAQHDHTDRVVSSLCGTVLLNLCLLLPLVIFFELAVGLKNGNPRPLPFPIITWRLDTLLLLVLGFALVPVALGRWMFARAEAIALVAIYAAYLLGETALNVGLLR